MTKNKIDILCIAEDKTFINRVEYCAQQFNYTFGTTSSIDTFAELEETSQNSHLSIISAVNETIESNIAGMVQTVRQFATETFIIVVVNKKISVESGQFIKKSGASLVINENDFLNTSKIDFISTQIVKGKYIPVKAMEFKVGTTPTFNLYHLLPMNQKFLPVSFANTEITTSKMEKIKTTSELYVKRECLKQYNEYLKQNQDLSAAGLESRVRAQYLLLAASYVDLALMFSDLSEAASFAYGKTLYEKVTNYASDLLMNLGTIGEAVNIINNSSIGEFGYVDRAPAIAAYAGLLSLSSGIGKPEDIMVAALLSDVGLLELKPSTMSKIRAGLINELSSNELELYKKHPLTSVNVALSRRLPIDQSIKDIIISTHEKADKTGFPNRPQQSEKIPHESQLIHFSEIVDQASMLKMGHERKSPIDVRKIIFKEHHFKNEYFTLSFMEKLKEHV